MVKKTLGYVELEWTRPNCGTRNPGPQKSCSSCGTAQPKKVDFHQGAEEELLTDDTEIERAQAGADVHCAFCGARNRAGATRCSQCGANLGSAEARESGSVLGAHRSNKAEPIACLKCGTLNDATASRCKQCNASLPRTPPDSPTQPPPKGRPPSGRRKGAPSQTQTPTRKWTVAWIALLVLVGLILCGIVVLASRCMRSEELTAQVQSVDWERTIEIETLSEVTKEGWKNDIPRETQLGDCRRKLHHTQDEPAPNATEVCGTPYTVDTGTGHGEVVQDCEYNVYADWCEYRTREWRRGEKVKASGRDLNVYWPSLNLTPGQREGEREAIYRVVFEAEGETYPYQLRDVDQYLQYETGSRWVIKVNGMGRVMQAHPPS